MQKKRNSKVNLSRTMLENDVPSDYLVGISFILKRQLYMLLLFCCLGVQCELLRVMSTVLSDFSDSIKITLVLHICK